MIEETNLQICNKCNILSVFDLLLITIYKSELPFCPEYREYLGLFIDLIIEISGQKGDFFWNFQFFLY